MGTAGRSSDHKTRKWTQSAICRLQYSCHRNCRMTQSCDCLRGTLRMRGNCDISRRECPEKGPSGGRRPDRGGNSRDMARAASRPGTASHDSRLVGMRRWSEHTTSRAGATAICRMQDEPGRLREVTNGLATESEGAGSRAPAAGGIPAGDQPLRIASTNSSGSKNARSSGPSPRPTSFTGTPSSRCT
jgi:hypothetical protein